MDVRAKSGRLEHRRADPSQPNLSLGDFLFLRHVTHADVVLVTDLPLILRMPCKLRCLNSLVSFDS